MDDVALTSLLYAAVQIASLIFLPKWWKLGAVPPLYAVVVIENYYRTGGYMADLMTAFFASMAIAWLLVVWLLLGLALLIRSLWRWFLESKGDDSFGTWLRQRPGRIWQWSRKNPVTAVAVAALLSVSGSGTGYGIYVLVRPPWLEANPDGESFTMRGWWSLIKDVEFSPDGRRLATVGWDRRLVLWDTNTWTTAVYGKGHADDIASVCYAPDGSWLVTAGSDDTVRLWDAETGDLLRTIEHPKGVLDRVVVDPTGRRMVTITRRWKLYLWDIASGRRLMQKHGGRDVAFSPDGQRFAAVSTELVTVWDAETGRECFALKGSPGTEDAENKQNDISVNTLAFSPDGQLLVAGCHDGTLRMFDAISGEHRMTLQGHTDLLMDLAFNADGRILASASTDGTIRLWDPQTGKERKRYRGYAVKIACSPDSVWLAGADRPEASFTLWRLASTPVPTGAD